MRGAVRPPRIGRVATVAAHVSRVGSRICAHGNERRLRTGRARAWCRVRSRHAALVSNTEAIDHPAPGPLPGVMQLCSFYRIVATCPVMAHAAGNDAFPARDRSTARGSTGSGSSTSATKGRIELHAVVKSYDAVIAVDHVNLTVDAGSYCCLLGPSGCGKTSTLRMVAGHEDISAGRILIDGHDVGELTPADRPTAMMFQNYALFPHLKLPGQRRVQPANAGHAQGAASRDRARETPARPHGRLPRAHAIAAIRRSAAAGGARTGAGDQPLGAPARRAAVRPGPVPARAHAR